MDGISRSPRAATAGGGPTRQLRKGTHWRISQLPCAVWDPWMDAKPPRYAAHVRDSWSQMEQSGTTVAETTRTAPKVPHVSSRLESWRGQSRWMKGHSSVDRWRVESTAKLAQHDAQMAAIKAQRRNVEAAWPRDSNDSVSWNVPSRRCQSNRESRRGAGGQPRGAVGNERLSWRAWDSGVGFTGARSPARVSISIWDDGTVPSTTEMIGSRMSMSPASPARPLEQRPQLPVARPVSSGFRGDRWEHVCRTSPFSLEGLCPSRFWTEFAEDF